MVTLKQFEADILWVITELADVSKKQKINGPSMSINDNQIDKMVEDCESDKGSESHNSDIIPYVNNSVVPTIDSDNESEFVPNSEESDSSEESDQNDDLPKFLQVLSHELEIKQIEEQPGQSCSRKVPQRQVKETEIVRDSKYKEIYIKKYLKSSEGKSGLKKDDRPYDTVHACLFCENLFTHIQDHIERKHHDQEEVKQILKLRKELKNSCDKGQIKGEIKKLQDCIRYSGDHKHNMLVKEYKEGELLIQRKSKEEFKFKDYGPCPECMQWIRLESSVKIHQKNCPKPLGAPKQFGKRNLILQANQLLGNANASEMLLKEVLPKMRNDEDGLCAQNDNLIRGLGDVWLSKSYSHHLRRGKDNSFHMRLASELLLECRGQLKEPNLDMNELLIMKKL